MGLSPIIHQHRIEVTQDIAGKLRSQKEAAHDEFCCNKGAHGVLRQTLTALEVKLEEAGQKAEAGTPVDHAAVLESVRQTILCLLEAAAANIVAAQSREAQAEESIKICQDVYEVERGVLQDMMNRLQTPAPPAPPPKPPSSAPRSRRKGMSS